MADLLVVTSKVKALGKEQVLRTSSGFVQRLSDMVERKTKDALAKAKEAGRQTVLAEDLNDSP